MNNIQKPDSVLNLISRQWKENKVYIEKYMDNFTGEDKYYTPFLQGIPVN